MTVNQRFLLSSLGYEDGWKGEGGTSHLKNKQICDPGIIAFFHFPSICLHIIYHIYPIMRFRQSPAPDEGCRLCLEGMGLLGQKVITFS